MMRERSSIVHKLLYILFCCFNVLAQREGDLRLAGNHSLGRQDPRAGNQALFGRLEIFINDVWGTICMHDNFKMESANTACRQLGRAEAVDFSNVDILSIDEGSGPIQLTNVLCLPSDDLIIQCPLGPFVPCTHAQDVVVACSSQFLEYDGAVRLVGGTYTSSGRLEVFLNNQWGGVCNSRFPIHVADVVCKQLQYTQAVRVDIVSSYRRNQPIWVTSVNCNRDNVCFKACYSVDSVPVDMRSICDHTADVYITCEYIDPLRTSIQVGNSQQCMQQSNDDEESNDNSLGTTLGLSLGLGIPALVIMIYILHKKKAFAKLKKSWNDFVHPQPETHNIESPQSNHVTTVPSAFSEPTGSSSPTASISEYDAKKPPNYNDALTYRKAEIPGEGYPESSLVDELPPPSYDSVTKL